MSAKSTAKQVGTETADADAAYIAAVEEARAEVDAGTTVSYAEVRAWLLSWGGKNELPPPKCD